MPKKSDLDSRLAKFSAALTKDKLSRTAVVHYVGVVRRGLEAGDVLAPLRGASSQGGLKIAKAAILRWAAFTRDADLKKQVRSILSPPRPKAKPATVTAEARERIATHVEAIPDPVRRGVLLLVLWSGLRVGEILALGREDLRLMDQNTKAGSGIVLLLSARGWKTVQELLSTTASPQIGKRQKPSQSYVAAYGTVRRTLRRVCKAAGVGYVQPEEFRRLVLASGQDKGSE